MNIHEYQAKQIFREFDIPVPAGGIASSPDAAVSVAENLDTDQWIVKAQIHAGGRGMGYFEDRSEKHGGVRRADSIEKVKQIAQDMLGHVLVTPQTGPAGREVKQVYVEQFCGDVQRELYLAMLVVRRTSRLTLVASAAGGEGIESADADSILRIAIDLEPGLAPERVQEVSTQLGFDPAQAAEFGRIAGAMFDLFTTRDASLIEINPLAVNTAGRLIALDAVVTLDDNALYRQPATQELRDEDEFLVGELEAAQHGLNYIKLSGNIGCLASGAGLSLATIDAIKLLGGDPANFLDVPPVAEVDRVRRALKLVLSDPDVESVLVNVFGGGIMRCDTIADALIMVNRESPIQLPLVVRLAGTNANFAVRRLRDMGPRVTFADDLADAAAKAVSAAKKKETAKRRSWWDKVTGTGRD